jgi:hypothetical protein
LRTLSPQKAAMFLPKSRNALLQKPRGLYEKALRLLGKNIAAFEVKYCGFLRRNTIMPQSS